MRLWGVYRKHADGVAMNQKMYRQQEIDTLRKALEECEEQNEFDDNEHWKYHALQARAWFILMMIGIIASFFLGLGVGICIERLVIAVG